MNKKIQIAINTPWKLINELLLYLTNPFIIFYVRFVCGVKLGRGAKFYGFPKILRHKGSKIVIGDRFECRNSKFSNPLGINHPTIICTWNANSSIQIGNDVGISGGSIVSEESIEIGNRVLIGANSTIIDSDFHPLHHGNKRYKKSDVKKEKVIISDDVFIGMSSIILKGVLLKRNFIVPAGAVIRHNTTFSTSRK